MRISDWSSDVCSSDLFRQSRLFSRNGLFNIAGARDAFGYVFQQAAHFSVIGSAAFAFDRADMVSQEVEGAKQRRQQFFSQRLIAVAHLRQHSFELMRILLERGKAERSEEHTSELKSLMR